MFLLWKYLSISGLPEKKTTQYKNNVNNNHQVQEHIVGCQGQSGFWAASISDKYRAGEWMGGELVCSGHGL